MPYDQYTATQDNQRMAVLYVPAGTPPTELPRFKWHGEWSLGGTVQELTLEGRELQEAKLLIEKKGYFLQRL
jgi:hypothetical protein